MTDKNAENAVVVNSQLLVSDSTVNKLSSSQTLNTTENESFKIYLDYHESEIEQNKKIYKLARAIIWVGFGVMMLGVVVSFFGQLTPAILTASAGILTEFVSGTVLIFLSQSSKSKQDYYKQLSFDEEFNKYIDVIKGLNLSEDNRV